MNFFISERKNKNDSEMNYKETPCYTQVEIPIDDDLSAYVYIMQRSDTTYYVGTCLDDMFDDFNADLIDVYNKAWPNFIQLLKNGINKKYAAGALIDLEDQDCGEDKWFLVTVVGNIQGDDTDKISDAMEMVMEKTISLLVELRENKPSMLDSFLKGIKEGTLKGLGIWLETIFG